MEGKRFVIGSDSIMLFLLSLIFLYSSSTFMQTRYSFYVAVISYFVFFALSKAVGHRWAGGKIVPLAILAALCSVIYYFNGASERITTYLSGVIYIFFWSEIFSYLIENYTVNQIKKFCTFNLIVLFASIIATLRVLAQYPLAARALNGAAENITTSDKSIFAQMGCGGFGFVYGFVFVSIALFMLLKNYKGRAIKRFALILIYLFVLYFILKSQFTTALLIAIAGLALELLINKEKFALNMVIIAIISVIILLFYQNILQFIGNMAADFGAQFISDKISMLLASAGSNDLESLSRYQKYAASIEGFFSSPIFGSGTAGGHSQIIDTFSSIGLFAVLYVGLLRSAFKQMRNYIYARYIVVFEFAVFLLAFLNPFVDSTVTSITFMLVPCIFFIASKEKETGEEQYANNLGR